MLRTRLRSRWRPGGTGSFFAGATLDMSFAQSRYLGATPTELTVTRASTAYADSSEGIWSSFGNNVARITNKGLLVEETRTNSIRNNSMQGATAGVLGSGGALPTNWSHTGGSTAGLTCTIVGTGAENGVEYIDIRYNGTTSATFFVPFFESSATNAASAAQVWTTSAFVKLVSGSLTNVTNFQLEGVSIGGTTTGSLVFNPTASLVRYSAACTMGASTTNVRPQIIITVTNAAAVDFTIRIGWPQLELGAFATSPIRTTSAAVTRAADAVSLQSTAFSSWYTNANAGTLFVEFVMNLRASGVVKYVATISDNTANNRVTIFVQTDGLAHGYRVSNAGTTTFNANGGATAADGLVIRTAMAWDAATSANAASFGTLIGADDATITAPVSPNRMYLGTSESGSGSYLNGYIRRLAYFPSRLANAELQSLSTV